MKGMADLTDAHWEYVRPFVKWDEQQRPCSDRRGGRWSEARHVLNGVLWEASTKLSSKPSSPRASRSWHNAHKMASSTPDSRHCWF